MAWKPDYITVADAKAFLGIADTVDDVELATAVTATSRLIDDRCNRQFGQLAAPAARVYRNPAFYERRSDRWLVPIDDVQDVTAGTINGIAYASQTGTLWPDNAPANGVPWTHLSFPSQPTMPLTAVLRWGWAAYPAGVVQAAKLQLNRLNARRRSPFGVAGSPDAGSEIRLMARLDPDAAALLTGLRRPGAVG